MNMMQYFKKFPQFLAKKCRVRVENAQKSFGTCFNVSSANNSSLKARIELI